MLQALNRAESALRPHTKAQYIRQFKLFLAFACSRGLTILDAQSTVLLFMEFLAAQCLSYRVICNYMSALKYFFSRYTWRVEVLSNPVIQRMLRGIRMTTYTSPSPKYVFSIHQLREISQLCDLFPHPLAYRAVFLVAFYAFFRMSNIAPTAPRAFDPIRHLTCQDVRFQYPGLHIKLKWAKNLQTPERVHWVKLPEVTDRYLCPVNTLRDLLRANGSSPSSFLFSVSSTSILTQSLIRKRLSSILRIMQLSPLSYGFHTFRRSAASMAFDANIPLITLQHHGHWRSDAIWAYISDNTAQSLQVPLAFQNLIHNSLP